MISNSFEYVLSFFLSKLQKCIFKTNLAYSLSFSTQQIDNDLLPTMAVPFPDSWKSHCGWRFNADTAVFTVTGLRAGICTQPGCRQALSRGGILGELGSDSSSVSSSDSSEVIEVDAGKRPTTDMVVSLRPSLEVSDQTEMHEEPVEIEI